MTKVKKECKEITVNGIVYVPKGSEKQKPSPSLKGMPFVIIRTEQAGVHFGYLKSRRGSEAQLLNSRRVWYWKGAASLSQMANDGVNAPKECKFSMEVSSITLIGVIEVIPTTAVAMENLKNVPIWKM